MRQQHIRSDNDCLMSNELSQLGPPAVEAVRLLPHRSSTTKDRGWRGRAHFFAIAGRAMRRLRLIDKGSRTPVPYVSVEELESPPVNLELAIDIDRLLNELAAIHQGWCAVVEMKCFLGLTDQEAAEVLNMRLHTLQHMWRNARGWLRERMEANATT